MKRRKRRYSQESLEPRHLLSAVSIFASGQEGGEQFQVHLNDQTVGTYEVGQDIRHIEIQTAEAVQPQDLKIEFINDFYIAGEVDRNLTIHQIDIDGTTYYPGVATTFSTGTWTEADNIVPGFGRGDTLHSGGYMQLNGHLETGTTLDLRVFGHEGGEQFNVLVQGEVVGSFVAEPEWTTHTIRLDRDIKASDVQIEFTNDLWLPDQGIDRNLTVDYIQLDGVRYEAEADSTYSTGAWAVQDGNAPGFGRGDTLHSGGYMQLDMAAQTGANRVLGSWQDQHLIGGNAADEIYSGDGNNWLVGNGGDDLLVVTGRGTNLLIGGAGNDTAMLLDGPLDYTIQSDPVTGAIGLTHRQDGNLIFVQDVEQIRFEHTGNQTFSAEDLVNNPNLVERYDIAIYGDNTLNRLLVMNNRDVELIQEIPIDGSNVYSVDYVTETKNYITPRGSNFVQLLHRNADGRFQTGKKIPLSFKPRTPNRNDNTGLVLYSGSDKPMFAIIDAETDKVLAEGGRDEITQGSFSNFDSKWATGHAQWLNDSQFLHIDREAKTVHLYAVTRDGDQLSVQHQDSLTMSESVHTSFGKRTLENGDIITFLPGEGSNAANNTDANLYELKVSGGSLSINRSVGVAGGLHHPGIHPDGQLIYAPTSNATVDIIDLASFQVIKQLPAGDHAGHVSFVKSRDMAIINNHGDTFVTVIDTRTHEVIKQVEVTTDDPTRNAALQAHTARVSKDARYYYNFSTEAGTYFRVNLDTLEKDAEYFTGGTPKQSSQPSEL